MGENEQGGMLRNVVILGLIALIASVITALVLNLRTKMVDHVDEATPPTVILNLLEPEDFQFNMHDGKGNFSSLPKSAYHWDDNQTVLHFDTTTITGPMYVRALSKRYEVPDGSKRLKVEIQVKGHTTQNVSNWVAFFDSNNKLLLRRWTAATHDLSDDKYTTVSKIIDVPEGAKTIDFTLETREDTVVEYKNATLTYYNH